MPKSRRQRDTNSPDRSDVKSDRIIRHVNDLNSNISASKCPYHFGRSCFVIANNFNNDRYHCLYANSSFVWKIYTAKKSCDIPEHFDDMKLLWFMLGTDYVLPFAGHFRESSGYCIGKFLMTADNCYPPSIVDRNSFKETFYTCIMIFCAVCYRMGGQTPNMKYFTFLFTPNHPILTDMGDINSDNKERISSRLEHFNTKKWKRFLNRKTTRDIIRYLRIIFPTYFQKRKGCCILNENINEYFDDETHDLICKSSKLNLVSILKKFLHLMPDPKIRLDVLTKWIENAS